MLDDLGLRHFLAFIAVAEERSFGRAADRLGFTQSAISQQIASFERSLGHTLFDRPGGPKQVELTPVGKAMLPHAEAIVAHANSAHDDVTKLLAGAGGHLTIGTFQSMTVKVLPEVIGTLRSEFPGLEIKLIESTLDEELIAMLSDGRVDIAFLIDPPDHTEFIVTHLGADPYVLIRPASMAAPPVIDREDLAELPMIGHEDYDACQRVVNQYLWSSENTPDFAFRSDDNAALQAMVRVGMGHAVMPYLAVEPADPGITVHEISPPLPPRELYSGQRAGRTQVPAAARCVELARATVARLERERVVQVAAP